MPPAAPRFRRYLAAWCCAWPTLIAAGWAASRLVAVCSALRDGLDASASWGGQRFWLDWLGAYPVIAAIVLGSGLLCGGIQLPVWNLVRRVAPRHGRFAYGAYALCGVLLGAGLLSFFLGVFWTYIRHGGPGSGEYAFSAGVAVCVIGAALSGTFFSFAPSSPIARPSRLFLLWLWRVFAAGVGAMTLALYAVGWEVPRFAIGAWQLRAVQGMPDATLALNLHEKGGNSFLSALTRGTRSRSRVFYWTENGRTVRLLSATPAAPAARLLATGELSRDAREMTLYVISPPQTFLLIRSR